MPAGAQVQAPWQALRAAFAAAASRLTPEQVALFEATTSNPLPSLVDRVLALPHEQLADALDLNSQELGNLQPHALNAKGLHVLKWLLARAIVDERRAANGWEAHPDHAMFARNGLLLRKLQNWRDEGNSSLRKFVALTNDEANLIALASGAAHSPYRCIGAGAADSAAADSAAADSSIAVYRTHEHVFRDDDDQYQLHVDVFMPNIKFMVFAERTRVETGPFQFVLGSHTASAAKARWLFERTRHRTDGGQIGAFRHVNMSSQSPMGGWCSASPSCLRTSYEWQQRDLADSYSFPRPMPIIVEAGTLVVADTSAFHFRGLGVAGERRALMGKLVLRCAYKRTKKLGYLVNVPRVPVLTCANDTAITNAWSQVNLDHKEANGSISVCTRLAHGERRQV